MIAELIAVGTELLLGNIANTDAQVISQGLSELGISVYFHTVVGDNPARLRQAVEIARNRSDILITTGGLGPTYDDLTKETVAACFGKTLTRHEPTWRRIQEYFQKIDRPLTPNNERQAFLPEGCALFENDWGTAPGCAFESGGKHVLMLPGPPRECVAMFRACAMPYLRALSGAGCLVSRNVRIFGMGESAVEDRLRDFMETAQNPTVAPYAKEGEVLLRVTARADTEEEAAALTEPAVAHILETLPGVVYGVDVDSLEQRVVHLLRDKGLTLALAESCTGGLVSGRITDIPGASKVYRGGVCAYANEAKTALLGVPAAMIEEHSAVSEPVARAMAEAVREKLNADIGVGVTGYAGPDGDPPGHVFMALSSKDGTVCRELKLGADRCRVRASASGWALDMVRRAVLGIAD